MRPTIVALVGVLTLCSATQASLYQGPFSPGSFDYPATGLVNVDGFTDNRTVGGLNSSILSVLLTLNFTDTAGLDYLTPYPSTMSATLTLRNGGTTYGTVTLNELTATANGIEWYYSDNLSTSFAGRNPNNTWSLGLSMASGSLENTLVSWNLDITAVPEPVTVALGIFGVLAAGFGLGRRFCARSRQ